MAVIECLFVVAFIKKLPKNPRIAKLNTTSSMDSTNWSANTSKKTVRTSAVCTTFTKRAGYIHMRKRGDRIEQLERKFNIGSHRSAFLPIRYVYPRMMRRAEENKTRL
jgi:hypothetical protein